jgi:phosphohistidine swiveling domain-containing protein
MPAWVIGFTDPGAQERAIVGGKAASLGRLAQAGFPVPAGFTVTTALYAGFLRDNGLTERIAERAGALSYDDAARLESETAAIRELILTAPIAESAQREIERAYRALGPDVHVAVRSSGTAEDLAEASFAGLHDTYLDIQGADQVVEAVRRCWASLWTARCAAYRQNADVDHGDALIAVVVQTMVSAEVSGVMFTANPVTARTDQIVINASWGLGEGIVSGILTPDEFILKRANLQITDRTTGSKERQVVRAPEGSGTVIEEVADDQRERLSLTNDQVVELAELGRRVSDHYDRIPQDIEWARADGRLYLLQARDVTGVELTWDEDLELWQTAPDEDETIWSHVWAEAYWTGAVTPLFYSVRARELRDSDDELFALWGFEDLRGVRRFKYRRATVYFSSDADRLYYRYILPPMLRRTTTFNLPPDWRQDAGEAPINVLKALRMHARVALRARGRGPYGFMKGVYDLIERGAAEADGPSAQELRRFSDEELKRNLAHKMGLAQQFLTLLRPGFHVYAAGTVAALNWMLANWYDGDPTHAFQDVISGLPQRTVMVEEQLALYRVSEHLNSSALLTRLIAEHEGDDFFAALEDHDEGREFLASYRRELAIPHGHRGHADRDIWYPRRTEDLNLDYRTLRTLANAGGMPDPEEGEHRLALKRVAATEQVVARVRRGPLGAVKARLFLRVLDYVHRFLVLRDDERHYIDRVTMAKKRSLQEWGRRLRERGLLDGDDDFYFLSLEELDQVAAQTIPVALRRAKVAGRRAVFNRYNARQEFAPTYLRGNRPIDLDSDPVDDSSGRFKGAGTSRGTVTGRARIVPDLSEIGRLERGDILICNGTDPGWASVFTVIGGLIIENGGMLAHGSCLSREYGLPAVTLANAMARIPDGSTITVNGDSGEIEMTDADTDQVDSIRSGVLASAVPTER